MSNFNDLPMEQMAHDEVGTSSTSTVQMFRNAYSSGPLVWVGSPAACTGDMAMTAAALAGEVQESGKTWRSHAGPAHFCRMPQTSVEHPSGTF